MAQNSVLKYHVTKTNLDVFYEIDMLPPYWQSISLPGYQLLTTYLHEIHGQLITYLLSSLSTHLPTYLPIYCSGIKNLWLMMLGRYWIFVIIDSSSFKNIFGSKSCKFPWYKHIPCTLANSTLIILISKMLKISKIISSKSKKIVKENSEYLGIFHLLKWFFQN
jgi:hypothetical protein